MTNPISSQKPQPIPSYSGVTINITSPTVNAAPTGYSEHVCNCEHCRNNTQARYVTNPQIESSANNPYSYNIYPQTSSLPQNNQYGNLTSEQYENKENLINKSETNNLNSEDVIKNSKTSESSTDKIITKENIQQIETDNKIGSQENQVENSTNNNKSNSQIPQQAYPAQYYLNNYNYIQDSNKGSITDSNIPVKNNLPYEVGQYRQFENNQMPEDMSSSNKIISELDSRVAEQKELEKNGKKTRVIELTNEYIMSLENYLNNPNTEIRLMAAKEILTRLDEDKDRYTDAALNALLNKMLQDPEKLVRIAALSAFSSQLASGNDFTVKLLTEIQRNPNSDKEDVLEASNILLKRTTKTEVRYTPVENNIIEQSPNE